MSINWDSDLTIYGAGSVGTSYYSYPFEPYVADEGLIVVSITNNIQIATRESRFGPSRIHVGDTVDFRHVIRDELDNIIDLSDATELKLTFIKPDGSVVEVAASMLTDGSDGILHYKAASDFITSQGDWGRQPFIKKPDGEWSGDLMEFTVYRKIKP